LYTVVLTDRNSLAAIVAGRLMLRELDRLIRSGVDFAFKSTLRKLRILLLPRDSTIL
jgi:predicted ABC-type ATPase